MGSATTSASGVNSRFVAAGLNNVLYDDPEEYVDPIDVALDPKAIGVDTILGGTFKVLAFKAYQASLKAQTEACEISKYANYKNPIDGMLDDIDADVWKMGPVVRGEFIDEAELIKNNLGHNFPVIDTFDLTNRKISSNKSYDITGKTYQDASKWLSKLKQDVRSIGNFTSKSWRGIRISAYDYDTKELNVVIPNVKLSKEHEKAILDAKNMRFNWG